jgi:predicted dehydrogenase
MMIGRRYDPISVLLVAIGGYGQHYLNALLDLASEPGATPCRLAGVVDPMARQSPAWPKVQPLGVPVHDTIEEFYAAGHEAHLAVVASPIHWHVPQSLVALANGSNVLCDKPLCATVQEANELRRRRDAARLWVMVGYQWSISGAIQALKQDILHGAFGAPKRGASLCCWPRGFDYYRRNDWAGRLVDATSGRAVLDSPANNAMAHFLHNLFYLLGPRPHLSARPVSVEAEMYRAYDIESADTTACRAVTDNGAELLVLTSHVTRGSIAPRFRLEFEDAVVSCGEADSGIIAQQRDGNIRRYPAPDDTPQFQKLRQAIDLCAHTPPACEEAVICGPEAAVSQTMCVNAMHESAGTIASFPARLVTRHPSPDRLSVEGLDELMLECWKNQAMPSEVGDSWTSPGRRVSVTP